MCVYHGIGVSDGIGIGQIFILPEHKLSYQPYQVTDKDSEYQRFENARQDFIQRTELLIEKAENNMQKALLSGHIAMISDPVLIQDMKTSIFSGKCCETSIEEICNRYIEVFSQSESETARQRVYDISDMKKRLLMTLLNIEEDESIAVPENSILCTEELTPSITVKLDKSKIAGIITEKGGFNSHAAILARSAEIPAVLGVKNITQHLQNKCTVIINGEKGEIFISPDTETVSIFQAKAEEYHAKKQELQQFMGKKTKTADGNTIKLFCNIGSPDDCTKVLDCDGEGVGLFRTEFLFMGRNSAPNEEEQLEAYKAAAIKMKGKPVIIRTLDIGGDKEIPYLNIPKEDNPFLGCRAIRYCLKHREIFRTQLRAIIQASQFGKIKIMIPMISSVDEMIESKKIIQEIKSQLKQEGICFDEAIPVGMMAETPAAALTADLLAKEADFFSIGTNDLIQYTMAVDRGNSEVSDLYSVYSPAVLRSIKNIIQAAKIQNIPVGMCGEAAADPFITPLLLSFGLDEFSVVASSVLSVRKNISLWNKKSADEITEHIMALNSAKEIKEYLSIYFQKKINKK